MVIHLIREERWAVQYPEIMGPRNAFFYFGPSSSPGQLAYGNGEPAPMLDYLQKKREGSKYVYYSIGLIFDDDAIVLICMLVSS